MLKPCNANKTHTHIYINKYAEYTQRKTTFKTTQQKHVKPPHVYMIYFYISILKGVIKRLSELSFPDVD